VLDRSCRQAKAWHDRWPDAGDLQISVNVAARQLEQPDFVAQVAEVVRSSGVDPAKVVLEVTETTLLHNADDAIAKLEALRRLGLGVAVDDFGTGYSSLNYIRRFPIDVLKIDKSFIDGITDEGEVSALTEAILQLSKILRLHAVAEGIETREQLDRLLELDCELGQGFLFARPLERTAIERLVASGRSSLQSEQEEAI
jgi:EAL domain-containing protein (putative c-di-GMP-specific phosphodiesterase class I)